MRSTLLLGTALLMSVGAIAHAQDMGGATPPSDPMTNPMDPTSNPNAPMPSTAPMPSSPQTPSPTTDPSATTAPAPMPSDSTMGTPAAPPPPDTAAMVTPAPATQDYPLCSATITDQCMQPSEAPRGYGKKKGMKRR